MFHDIPDAVRERMRYLEEMDARHRREERDHFDRLRQIPPETGRFLALLASGAPDGAWIEIGASGGYSAMWIALAARARGACLTTFEISDKKVEIARETFLAAGLDDVVDLVHGDAREHLDGQKGIAFCFLDAEKECYPDCYEAVVPNMVAGGILAADNVISHEKVLGPWNAEVLSDPVWQGVPWLQLARRELAAGRLPLWNPHQDGGVPLLGNSQSALLSPLVWPALALGVEHGWNLSLLLRVLLAATATVLWLRTLGRSPLAATLGGLMVALSGPFVAWLEHPHTLAVAAAPVLLVGLDAVARRGGRVRKPARLFAYRSGLLW